MTTGATESAHPSLKQSIGAVNCSGGSDGYGLQPVGCSVNDNDQMGETL
jgi:hypothetical protein